MTEITNLHLFTFLDRLDAIRENLHLRTLTDREVQEIVERFQTTTSGVYNPIYSIPKRRVKRWRNVKEIPYITKEFTILEQTPLTVRHEVFRLKRISLKLLDDLTSKKINSLVINKYINPLKKRHKLQVLLNNDSDISQTLNINTNLQSTDYTPISVKTWIKNKILSKLGVLFWIKNKISSELGVLLWIKNRDTIQVTSRANSRFLYCEDIGTISDIEMIETLEDVRRINELRNTVS